MSEAFQDADRTVDLDDEAEFTLGREDEQPRDDDQPQRVRLQKVLAQAGVASRRASEIMITEGRVEVNGDVVTEL